MSRGSIDLSRRGVLAGAGAAAFVAPAYGQSRLRTGPEDWPAIDQAVLDLLPNQMTRLAVPVSVNGQGPFHFVVDTGANRTAIAEDLAAELELPDAPPVIVHGVTSAQMTPTARIHTLNIGGSRFRNLNAPLFPRSRMGADGLLGVDVLGDFRLTLDLANGRLEMRRSAEGILVGSAAGSRLIRHAGAIRGRQRFGQLTVVQVRVDEVQVIAFVDTGSQYTIGNQALFQAIGARRPGLRERALSVPIVGVTGQIGSGEIAVTRTLRLGMSLLLDTPVIFADLHAFEVWALSERPALLLGADVIGRLSHVTLDFGLSEMEFGEVTQLRPLRDRRPG